MKIHEYQAKEIFKAAGIPVPRERPATSPKEALAAAEEIGPPVMVKAQVLVGGRGKAGGVKKADSLEQVEGIAERILGMTIKGLPVRKVLVSECVDIKAEYYLGIVVDRASRMPVLMASAAGGVEIELVAKESPEKILKCQVDSGAGLLGFQARDIGMAMFRQTTGGSSEAAGDAALARRFAAIARQLYRVFVDQDCSLIEINPLVRLGDGTLLALDAKINFDDNALFRHTAFESLRDMEAEEPKEVEAKRAGLSYIKLDGNVGCVVNGAGLAMATMDLIKRYGGEPANFLDVGGSSSPEKMVTAMKIILGDRNVRAILVNIFGGITRCDDIAAGLIQAAKQGDIGVPVVARLTGTNAERARELLTGSQVTPAATMSEAVRKAVELAGGAR